MPSYVEPRSAGYIAPQLYCQCFRVVVHGTVPKPYRQQQGVVMGNAAPALYTVEEAAKLLRIGRTKAYALTQEWRTTGGKSGLPVVDFGHVLRVPRAALEQLLGIDLTRVAEPGAPARVPGRETGADAAPAKPANAPSPNRRRRPTTSDAPDQLDLFNIAS